jgi:hypothetical protein
MTDEQRLKRNAYYRAYNARRTRERNEMESAGYLASKAWEARAVSTVKIVSYTDKPGHETLIDKPARPAIDLAFIASSPPGQSMDDHLSDIERFLET